MMIVIHLALDLQSFGGAEEGRTFIVFPFRRPFTGLLRSFRVASCLESFLYFSLRVGDLFLNLVGAFLYFTLKVGSPWALLGKRIPFFLGSSAWAAASFFRKAGGIYLPLIYSRIVFLFFFFYNN